MATTTPYLALALLGTGESVGTWGTPLNNNFSKIDILAGEIITARGSEADINERFNTIESEISEARGTLPRLDDRLSHMLNDDGTIRIENMPTSTTADLGVTRLSVNPAVAGQPIAVGDNDPRVLTTGQVSGLTGGGNTTLHSHTLAWGATDVSATASEVNQALDGIGASVTAVKLTALTNGTQVDNTYHTHPDAGFGIKGFSQLSVTPLSATSPIAVGDNDPRVLTQTEHNELTSAGVTALHGHNLVDGARDLTVTATVLNQLTGAGATVTASNLNLLTNGADITSLHHHDNRYYTKAQSDATTTSLQNYANNAVTTHNNSNTAHQGDNLQLGDVTLNSFNINTAGITGTIQANGADTANQLKFVVKDFSGVNKATIDASGNLVVENLTVNGTSTIVDTETIQNDAVVTDDLTVNGDTTLGDNNAVDNLVVNCVTSTFNGDLSITGGITISGTVDGVDVSARDAVLTATVNEITTARNGEANLANRINGIGSDVTAVENEISNARNGEVDLVTRINNVESDSNAHNVLNNNPHTVTITQAVAADGGTDVTVTELETLTDGSNADALHVHAATDAELTAARNSAIYGAFGSLDARMEASDTILNNHNTEIVNARGPEASIDARLDAIESDVSSNSGDVATAQADAAQANADLATHESDNANPHSVTITQAIAADGGTDITVGQLETLTDGSNADALHTHPVLQNEITAARNSSVYGAFGSIDARLESTEGILNGHTTEINNAKGGEVSIDARLDAIEGDVSQNTGDIATNTSDITSVTNEVTTARGGEANLDTRLDNIESDIVTAGYSNTYSANTSFTVTHNLGTKKLIVQVRDTGGDAYVAISSISFTNNNEISVTIGSSLAVEITVIAYLG